MDLETFRKLATDRRVIPVSRKLLVDGDTPVALREGDPDRKSVV